MRRVVLFALAASFLYGCHKEQPKVVDPDAGKHRLSENDPRGWRSYPVLLLVSTKHGMGIDTVQQIITVFNHRFGGHDHEVDLDVQMPEPMKFFEEDTRPIQDDIDFLATVGQRVHRRPAEVAGIIADFYTIGGSNRDFPECTSN